GRFDRNDPFFGIDGSHRVALLRPIPKPIAMNPGFFFFRPAPGAVAVVGKSAFLAAFGSPDVHLGRAQRFSDLYESIVWPSGEGHWVILKEQLQPLSARGDVAKICYPLRSQVSLPHTSTRGG